MSTVNRRDAKSAAKRRAATRRRIRGLGKYIFAYSIIAILVIGTVSAVFIAQVPVSTGDTGVPTVVPTSASGANDTLAVLAKNGDDAINAGRYTEALTFYRAYLGQNPADGDVQFKLGKAYVSDQNPQPDYVAGVDHLQRALSINPNASYAAEAQTLIQQWGTRAIEGATATAQASSAVTTTTGITNTDEITPSKPLTP